MTPREEERQPMSSSCWPRCCTPPLLESTGFSFTEFSYSFTFSCSLLLLLSPFLGSASSSSSAPASGGQGRGAALCKPGARAVAWPAGMLQELCDLFPFPGRPAHHLCHVLKLHRPTAWNESSRGESVRRQSQGCAAGNPISSGPFIS